MKNLLEKATIVSAVGTVGLTIAKKVNNAENEAINKMQKTSFGGTVILGLACVIKHGKKKILELDLEEEIDDTDVNSDDDDIIMDEFQEAFEEAVSAIIPNDGDNDEEAVTTEIEIDTDESDEVTIDSNEEEMSEENENELDSMQEDIEAISEAAREDYENAIKDIISDTLKHLTNEIVNDNKTDLLAIATAIGELRQHDADAYVEYVEDFSDLSQNPTYNKDSASFSKGLKALINKYEREFRKNVHTA